MSVYVFYPAPSQVTVIRKEKTSRNSVSLSWQQPERPNGIILDYEIKYYEKVGVKYITVNALPHVPLSKAASLTEILKGIVQHFGKFAREVRFHSHVCVLL